MACIYGTITISKSQHNAFKPQAKAKLLSEMAEEICQIKHNFEQNLTKKKNKNKRTKKVQIKKIYNRLNPW